MNVLFIRPRPSPETIGLQHIMIVEPLELEILASLLHKEDIPVIVDMILEKESVDYYIKKEKPDILCITGYITHTGNMIHCCSLAKEIDKNITTIVGGVHCEVCSSDFNHPDIDYRVVHNATRVFPLLIESIRNGTEKPPGVLCYGETIQPEKLPQFDFFMPLARRDLTKKYRNSYFYIFHHKVALIKTSFGCPFSCTFCFCRQITRGVYAERAIDEVLYELKQIREKEIYIVDDNFLFNPERVRQFIKGCRDHKIDKRFLLYGRSDFIAHNPGLIREFYSVGLRTVIIGIESFIDDELESYDKKINAGINELALRVLHKYNIDCYVTIIVSPKWGKKEFSYCEKKLKELKIHYVNLQPLTPLPGTGVKIREEELLIPYSDYKRWDLAHVTIRPEKMGLAEFYQHIVAIYDRILFQPGIMLRYMFRYPPGMLIKMAKGSYKIRRQYQNRIQDALKNA